MPAWMAADAAWLRPLVWAGMGVDSVYTVVYKIDRRKSSHLSTWYSHTTSPERERERGKEWERERESERERGRGGGGGWGWERDRARLCGCSTYLHHKQ